VHGLAPAFGDTSDAGEISEALQAGEDYDEDICSDVGHGGHGGSAGRARAVEREVGGDQFQVLGVGGGVMGIIDRD